ncbi:MAG: hypothetical protein JNK19_16160 [Tabrizicola sp.]|nr:hypothetical protein [Tabrizicola sp.]
MLHAAIFGAVNLACVFAGDMAIADQLVQTCKDGTSINFAKTENVNKVSSVRYQVVVEDFDAVSGRFNLRIAPAAGLSEKQARFQAQLTTGVICMQFDSPSAETGAGQELDDAWLFSSGCKAQELQMVLQC